MGYSELTVVARSNRWMMYALGAGGLATAAIIGLVFFAPKGSTEVDEQVRDADAEPVLQGMFSGADDAHHVSGIVTVYRSEGGFFLRFEEYAATNGPDVNLYLSPSVDGSFGPDAIRIPVPGGSGDGHATLRGNFNVPLPNFVDPDHVKSAIIWCRRFAVPFGQARLHAPS